MKNYFPTMGNLLKESIESGTVIDKNGYPYLVCPILDGIPVMNPKVLRETIDLLKNIGQFDCDLILAPEAMSLPLAIPLALELEIPYSVIRKRPYGLDGEIEIGTTTGYSKSSMYINGLKGGERIVIVDDVVSTGGTLKAIIDALREIDCTVTEVLVAVDKSDDISEVSERLGVDVRAAVKLCVENGIPKVN